MKKIIINNFGPIKELSLQIDKPINVLIGAQASGKSTFAKSVYFCKKIRDYLVEFLLDSTNFIENHPNELYVQFLKYIRKNFMGCFGTTKHLKTFKIMYYYDLETETNVTFSLDYSGFVNSSFSSSLRDRIKKIIYDANDIYKSLKEESSSSFLDKFKKESQLLSVSRKHFIEVANEIFYDDSDIIYIPAGRSILSTFSEQLYDVNVTSMDTTMQEFINLTRTTRSKFNSRLEDLVENYTKTIKGQINNADVKDAILIINKILKGDYVCDKDGEKIYYDVDKWVKLMFASSGQQESLWTLMLMFSYVLEKRKAFIVLEEPEAHLFPEAQKFMVELISLFCNSTNSSILLTTHSPYVLTSINLLVHSYKVENNKRLANENRIVRKVCRINPAHLSANMIMANFNPNIKSILDKSTSLIDAFQIDGVSNIINDETEQLLKLEVKYGL